ncbi:helix-turn-helix domain-containing protein [Spirosoma soli]|uniref:Helix-turn-helix domain-containing protein n=1 Tax=Spirosoma soli TaxID=1770529 RepID=A0ABW5M604_9BACT
MQTLPVHLDLFALIILLGVAQGVFLGVFFLTGSRAKSVANRCLGWFTLALAAISAEIFLNYTNYTFRILWTVDLAEPFNFVLGPLFYGYVYSRIWQRLPRWWGWHFVPFAIWLVNAITWIYQPVEFKYNSYLDSWHPELTFVAVKLYLKEDFTGLRDIINEMTLVSCIVYAVLALLTIRNATRQDVALRTSTKINALRVLSWLYALVSLLIVLVKPQFYNDLGDYLLATYMAVTIYTISFLVMRGSNFFEHESQPALAGSDVPPLEEAALEPRKKYEKSSLSEEVEEAVLAKLNRIVDTEKPHLQPDLSLPKLAQQVDTSPHHLSQLLNDRLGQNFFDWLATYRIAEAQRLLHDPMTANLKIDEIAERVGYNSPSAFHTAFKRLTGQTPAQFRSAVTSSRSARTS